MLGGPPRTLHFYSAELENEVSYSGRLESELEYEVHRHGLSPSLSDSIGVNLLYFLMTLLFPLIKEVRWNASEGK